MPETDNNPKHEPLTQRRRKAVQAILQGPSDEDVAPEHKNAIQLRQDLLFGFRMNLETYEECREALLNLSAAACIYCGTMICSFAENDLRMGSVQISTCSATFFQAGEDLVLAEDAGLLHNTGAEAEIMMHLGNSVEAIEYVARQLHFENLLS